MAIGLGAGIAFLLDLLNPTVLQSADLVAFGLPVLGTIGFESGVNVGSQSPLRDGWFITLGVCLLIFSVVAILFANQAANLFRML